MTGRLLKHTRRTLAGGLLVLGATGLAQAADPIRIGAPLSLTGSLADEGGKEQQGLDMCIDAVNAKGGVKVGSEMRKLEAVKYDYQSETGKAVQLVQRLLTVDKVDYLFAPYGPATTSGDGGAGRALRHSDDRGVSRPRRCTTRRARTCSASCSRTTRWFRPR